MSGAVGDLLQAKGALKVPVLALRDVIWKAYLRHVQPSFPLLDVEKFTSAMNDPGGQKSQISLLLYQAVMFAGFLFVDLSDPCFAGIPLRKDILKSMFENIKVKFLSSAALLSPVFVLTTMFALPAPLRFRLRPGPNMPHSISAPYDNVVPFAGRSQRSVALCRAGSRNGQENRPRPGVCNCRGRPRATASPEAIMVVLRSKGLSPCQWARPTDSS